MKSYGHLQTRAMLPFGVTRAWPRLMMNSAQSMHAQQFELRHCFTSSLLLTLCLLWYSAAAWQLLGTAMIMPSDLLHLHSCTMHDLQEMPDSSKNLTTLPCKLSAVLCLRQSFINPH